MLMLPDRSEPETLVPFEPREKLFHTLLRSNDWGEKMEIETVGDLNDKICEGDLAEMILVQEARQERRIAAVSYTHLDVYKRQPISTMTATTPYGRVS